MPKLYHALIYSEHFGVAEKVKKGEDQLLLALLAMCQLLDQPNTPTNLIEGLPLEEGKLTLALLPRAVDRAGLRCRIAGLAFNEIHKPLLPVVLMLKDNSTCIVTNITAKSADVIMPMAGMGVKTMSYTELEEMYGGICIFMRQKYTLDQELVHVKLDDEEHWLWAVFKKHKDVYSKAVVTAFVGNLFAILLPLFSMAVYDRILPNFATDTMWVFSIGLITVFVFDFLMKNVKTHFVDTASKNADIILSSRLIEKLLKMRDISQIGTVGAVSNHIRELDVVRDFFSSVTFSTLIDMPFVLLFIFVMYLVGGPIFLIPIVAILFLVSMALRFQSKILHAMQRMQVEGGYKNNFAVQLVQGIETIRASRAEGHTQRRWELLAASSAKSSQEVNFYTSFMMNACFFAQNFTFVCVLILGVYVANTGSLTSGGLIACSMLASRAMGPFTNMVMLLMRWTQVRTSLQSLDLIMKGDKKKRDGMRYTNKPTLSGSFQFDGVVYRHNPMQAPLFDGLNFKIQAQSKVAFMGRIGSGKTTVAKLLLALRFPEGGAIYADDINYQQLSLSDLRRNIGYVEQQTMLFPGTIRENLTLGKMYIPDQEILTACYISGAIHVLKKTPGGLEGQVDEMGRNFSGGERQALGIARALIGNPPILIFDEPTAMMDQQTQENFVQNLAKIVEHKTLILITHSSRVLNLIDRIIVLDDGKIIADRPKDELMSKQMVAHETPQ